MISWTLYPIEPHRQGWWGFGNELPMFVQMRREHKRLKNYYVSIRNRNGRAVGGVSLHLRRKKKERTGHVFTERTLSLGLDVIRQYFEDKGLLV